MSSGFTGARRVEVIVSILPKSTFPKPNWSVFHATRNPCSAKLSAR